MQARMSKFLFLFSMYSGTRPADKESRKSPKYSPMYEATERLARLPPLYMVAGAMEILEDDTVHFAGKARTAGCDVKLVVRTHPHTHPVFKSLAMWYQR